MNADQGLSVLLDSIMKTAKFADGRHPLPDIQRHHAGMNAVCSRHEYCFEWRVFSIHEVDDED